MARKSMLRRPKPLFVDGELVNLVNNNRVVIKGHSIVGDPIWLNEDDAMTSSDGIAKTSGLRGWRYETTFELGSYIHESQIRKLPPSIELDQMIGAKIKPELA